MVFHISHRRSRRRRSGKLKGCDDHDEFMSRITKTCYYGAKSFSPRLSLPLSEIAAEAFSEAKIGKTLDRLRIEDAAELSLAASVSPCSLVLAVLYLEQLKTCNPAYLDSLDPSDLFIVSVMVGAKVLNDEEWTNGWWAERTGRSLEDINRLEAEFLQALNWELFVDESRFWHALRQIEQTIALRQAVTRGWFSYTDLDVLSESADALALAQTFITMSFVCLATYAAGVITIAGSSCLAAHLVTSGFYERALAMTSMHSILSPPSSSSFKSPDPMNLSSLNSDMIACHPHLPSFVSTPLPSTSSSSSSSYEIAASQLPHLYDLDLNDSMKDAVLNDFKRLIEGNNDRRSVLPYFRDLIDFTAKYLDYYPPLIKWKS